MDNRSNIRVIYKSVLKLGYSIKEIPAPNAEYNLYEIGLPPGTDGCSGVALYGIKPPKPPPKPLFWRVGK